MSDEHLVRAHQNWLGILRPEGLVVAPRALVEAQAILESNAAGEQRRLEPLLKKVASGGSDSLAFPSFQVLAKDFLNWEEGALLGPADLPDTLEIVLPEYAETLRPTYAVADAEGKRPWLMLVREEPMGTDLDKPDPSLGAHKWHASPQARFERLLREKENPVGVLTNGIHLRLIYAPKGESTSHVTFPATQLANPQGRDLVAALMLLLGRERLFPGPIPEDRRLHALLARSRKYQNDVSEDLAEQVLDALWDLLRGFQAANEATKGELLGEVLEKDPQSIYGGLLGTLMRLVFILYAEDRGLMPKGEVYARHYAVGGLFERLRDDYARFPETLDQRYGAWAHLLTLFRLIHDGGAHGDLRLPQRHGRLFDPDTWDFLEGRPYADQLDRSRTIDVPKVPDGTVYRVLDKLIFLKGERISYRTLDVEEIGSVYEAMMGFELREATAPSVALRPKDIVLDLATLLADKPEARIKRLADEAECKVEGKTSAAVKQAQTLNDLIAALGKKVSPRTPTPVPKGGLYLQPTEERRRSGSHYTPRSLTKPIVENTLRPILKNLGARTPDQILSLKVCDPAMGSGAFLVEACRFLGEALVESWNVHGGAPRIPPDEDPLIHAQRLVATRCLYGVDKNERAVDLAKLSLWLATLAKDHPFTFLDHSLRHGDSLVGLTNAQIAAFHWKPQQKFDRVSDELERALKAAATKRAAIHALGDAGDVGEKAALHDEAQHETATARRAGDLVIAAFFSRENEKARDSEARGLASELLREGDGKADPAILDIVVAGLRRGSRTIPPFHWEIEFPEVFSRENGGFDAFVGNPPFLGGKRISTIHGDAYRDWLATLHQDSNSNADLVAHFFRRAFLLLRVGGSLGLLATNTIAQGDTRSSGLRWICVNGGIIYSARKRYKWPGKAAVVVSIVHIAKLPSVIASPRPQVVKGISRSAAAFEPFILDSRPVPQITGFLFHDGGHESPAPLRANAGKSFIGSYVLGMGFTFDDSNPDATPIVEMHRLIEKDPRNAQRIFPYIGGEEVNDSPNHAHHRYVINFGEMTEEEARRWPDLMTIVEAKVRPVRAGVKRDAHRERWWRYGDTRPGLYAAIRGLDRVLVTCQTAKFRLFAFLLSGQVFSHKTVVFPLRNYASFALLSGQPHEFWSRLLGSTMKDDPVYTPSDCFETFPLPAGWETNPGLEAVGAEYYNFRAALMVRNDEGLTKTYNRFHDPYERDPEIRKLRDLHAAMDRAVLDAYGWQDIQPTCEFLLDYEEEEEEGAAPSKKKKPRRYRWPDEVRDEVLARLLALNAERAKEEALAGASAVAPTKPKKAGKKTGRSAGSMFEEP